MKEIRMTIHMVPTAKGRPRFARMGKFVKTYTPKETLAAESNILAQALPHKPVVPFENRVSMEIRFFMPVLKGFSKTEKLLAQDERLIHTKKPDGDNLTKAVWDSLNGVFFKDDALIWKYSVEKLYSNNPRIEITILGE